MELHLASRAKVFLTLAWWASVQAECTAHDILTTFPAAGSPLGGRECVKQAIGAEKAGTPTVRVPVPATRYYKELQTQNYLL
jgi:hypothetical protein